MAVLQEVVEEMSALISKAGPDIYPSQEMKTGICQDGLKKWECLLISLMKIDPRGAIFRQQHVVQALRLGLTPSDYSSMLENTLARFSMSPTETLEMIAYKVRVMASHCRITYDNAADVKSHQLRDIFKWMRDAPKGSTVANDVRKARRSDRIGKRQNPFIFAGVAVMTCLMPRRDTAHPICSQLNGSTAQLLRSNGTRINADSYCPGPTGFAIAKWLGMQKEMTLEIPNHRLTGVGGAEGMPPLPPPAVAAEVDAAAEACEEAEVEGAEALVEAAAPADEVKLEPNSLMGQGRVEG